MRPAVLFFAATVVLHSVLALVFAIGPHAAPDTIAYDQMAQRVSHGQGLSFDDPYAPSLTLRSFRSPVYAIVVGALYAVFGYHPLAAVVFQILLAGLLSAIVYLWSRRILTERDARIAGVLATGYWASVYFESQILSEVVFVAAFTGTLFLVEKIRRDGGRAAAFVAGVLLGASALTRPAGIAFLPAAWFVLLFLGPPRKNEVALLTAGTLAVLIPWWIRNEEIHGTFVPFLTSGGIPFWDGNRFWPGTLGGDPPASAWEYLHRNPGRLSEVALDRWIFHDALRRILADPGAWLVVLARKAVLFFDPRPRGLFQIPYRLLAPWFALGIALSLRKLRKMAVPLAAGVCQYLFTIAFLVDLRYRYPAEIAAIPFAAAGIGWVWTCWGVRVAALLFAGNILLQALLVLFQRTVGS